MRGRTGRVPPCVQAAAAVLFALFLACVPAGQAQAQSDPFGASRAPQGESAAQASPASPPATVVPAPVRKAMAWITETQRRLYSALAAKTREIRETGAWGPALGLIVVAFLYGVFHAVGPGHGKVVVASYFAAREARLSQGIFMGVVIAATQAVVAIGVIGVLYILMGGTRSEIMRQAVTLELVSYGLITALGSVMLWRLVRGRAWCCGHRHHAHEDCPESAVKRFKGLNLGGALSLGVAAGARPCAGALLVLLFALANGIFMVGVAATLFMALGVAITISVLGMATILMRRSLVGAAGLHPALGRSVTLGLSYAGALLVTLLGIAMFIGAWNRETLLG